MKNQINIRSRFYSQLQFAIPGNKIDDLLKEPMIKMSALQDNVEKSGFRLKAEQRKKIWPLFLNCVSMVSITWPYFNKIFLESFHDCVEVLECMEFDIISPIHPQLSNHLENYSISQKQLLQPPSKGSASLIPETKKDSSSANSQNSSSGSNSAISPSIFINEDFFNPSATQQQIQQQQAFIASLLPPFMSKKPATPIVEAASDHSVEEITSIWIQEKNVRNMQPANVIQDQELLSVLAVHLCMSVFNNFFINPSFASKSTSSSQNDKIASSNSSFSNNRQNNNSVRINLGLIPSKKISGKEKKNVGKLSKEAKILLCFPLEVFLKAFVSTQDEEKSLTFLEKMLLPTLQHSAVFRNLHASNAHKPKSPQRLTSPSASHGEPSPTSLTPTSPSKAPTSPFFLKDVPSFRTSSSSDLSTSASSINMEITGELSSPVPSSPIVGSFPFRESTSNPNLTRDLSTLSESENWESAQKEKSKKLKKKLEPLALGFHCFLNCFYMFLLPGQTWSQSVKTYSDNLFLTLQRKESELFSLLRMEKERPQSIGANFTQQAIVEAAGNSASTAEKFNASVDLQEIREWDAYKITNQWFGSFFAKQFSLSQTMKLWDCLFSMMNEKNTAYILPCFGLAILQLQKKKLLNLQKTVKKERGGSTSEGDRFFEMKSVLTKFFDIELEPLVLCGTNNLTVFSGQ